MAGGLGKGLDSLIPNYYDENFDSNGSESLEDILNNDENSKNEIESIIDDITSTEDENDDEKSIVEDESEVNTEDENDDEKSIVKEEDIVNEDENETEKILTEKIEQDNTEDIAVQENVGNEDNSSTDLPNTQEVKKNENVAEVLDIVDKNPRITLWSSRSAAVFRYLRKTEPEFSISREASILIDEAVSKKYPHIWELFEGV